MTRSYEKYKSIENYGYIDSIPSEWDLLPNIAIFDERISKGHVDEELISVTIGRGIIRQSEIENKKDNSNEDKSNYKLVKVGDIAYNKMRMWQGSVGYSQYRGIVSPAYVVLKPKIKINPKYYHYLFRTKYYNNYARRFSYGLCDDQLNLRYSDFKRMYSIVPSLETQNKIVEYLEKKEKQCNQFIKKQEELIQLLKDKRKSVVTEYTVTSLYENNTKKFEGNWINSIPSHWDVRKLKFCVTLVSEQTNKINADEVFISLEKIESWLGIYNLNIGTDEFESSVKKFKPKDVLFGRLRPYLAKVISPVEKGVCVGELLVLRPKKIITSEYLKYILLNENVINLIDSSTFGSKMPRANWDFIGQIHIPLPPLYEQESIVSNIKNKLNFIDSAINKVKEEIEVTKQYLESLIFNVVTGKIQID